MDIPERCRNRQSVLTKRPVKWSANRITTKADCKAANEVKETIIESLTPLSKRT